MGITKHTFDLIMRYTKKGNRMLELGAQNIYFGEKYGEFAKPYFESLGIEHVSVDLNGEGGAIVRDLTNSLDLGIFNVVTNAGTSEHTSDLYECFKNMWDACEEGGYIVCENPKTGNWPGHGNYYMTMDFYRKFPATLKEVGEHPAMGNQVDGWNVYAVIQKDGEFPSREEFEKLDFRNE